MNNSYLWASLFLVAPLYAGCSDAAGGSDADGETGTLQAALGGSGAAQQNDLRSKHDVAKIHYVVVFRGQACTDKPLAEMTVDLEDLSLPTSLLPEGGANHPFGDALIVLAAGQYTVCATPLTRSGAPSAECAPTSGLAFIAPAATTEITLISQCKGADSGAVDGITVLNSPPVIDNLIINPSKFITACETAQLTVEAHDPDGDSLTYLWQLLGTNLFGTRQMLNFTSNFIGTSQLRITVSDPFGAKTSLTFPMHVTPCPEGGTN